MRIAIIGYGKMGRMIEEIALRRGHEISCTIDKDNIDDLGSEAFRSSDVAIEFTTPDTAVGNIEACFAAGVPVVCGTTAWTVRKAEGAEGVTMLEMMRRRCDNGEGTLLWASNFSIGVNIFMAVNRYLAHIMSRFPQYVPSMTEVHHVHKLDHPSGTAITLAEDLVASHGHISGWSETPAAGKMTITALREGEVPGIHTIKWDSDVDDITISHSAKSRRGFALGAVMAAEWLVGKKGFKTISEMMDEYLK